MENDNLIPEIKRLWKDIDNKTEFIKNLSTVFKQKPSTMKSSWFANLWQVPKSKQKRTLIYIKKYKEIQNKSKGELKKIQLEPQFT